MGRWTDPMCLACCQFPQEFCDNHQDDDFDRLVDCDDPDCALQGVCP